MKFGKVESNCVEHIGCKVNKKKKDNINNDPYSQKVKQSIGKTSFHLLPYDALEEISKVFNDGIEKYGNRSWETDGKVAYSRLMSACLRHLFAWWQQGERNDVSSRHHLAHVCVNVMMLLSYEIRDIDRSKLDDRPDLTKGKLNV